MDRETQQEVEMLRTEGGRGGEGRQEDRWGSCCGYAAVTGIKQMMKKMEKEEEEQRSQVAVWMVRLDQSERTVSQKKTTLQPKEVKKKNILRS